MAAVGLLAAERYRRQSVQGQHVKLALEDVAYPELKRLTVPVIGIRSQLRVSFEISVITNIRYTTEVAKPNSDPWNVFTDMVIISRHFY